MIIYSVSVTIDPDREAEWVSWMRQTHLPEVMTTGCFVNYRFTKVLHDVPDATGTTYNAQYLVPSHAHYNLYLENFAPALQAKTKAKFGGSFAAFRTLLELVDEGSYEG